MPCGKSNPFREEMRRLSVGKPNFFPRPFPRTRGAEYFIFCHSLRGIQRPHPPYREEKHERGEILRRDEHLIVKKNINKNGDEREYQLKNRRDFDGRIFKAFVINEKRDHAG